VWSNQRRSLPILHGWSRWLAIAAATNISHIRRAWLAPFMPLPPGTLLRVASASMRFRALLIASITWYFIVCMHVYHDINLVIIIDAHQGVLSRLSTMHPHSVHSIDTSSSGCMRASRHSETDSWRISIRRGSRQPSVISLSLLSIVYLLKVSKEFVMVHMYRESKAKWSDDAINVVCHRGS